MDYLLGSAYPALDHHPAVISMSSHKEKVSARERARASYYANRERYLERGRAWRAANKEKVMAYNAAYHAENRERENARSQAWKAENREGMNARRRADYAADPEQARAYARNKKRASYARNPQKYRDFARLERRKPGVRARQSALAKAWAQRNPERRKAIARLWYRRNLDHARLQLVLSQAFRRRRNVPWANREAIALFYVEAALLTRTTGRRFVVDHIIPLKGREVSGLHVETNLRVVERFDNARKSNKWESPGWEQPSVLPGKGPRSLGDGLPSQLGLF
jgi:hypothetical protein